MVMAQNIKFSFLQKKKAKKICFQEKKKSLFFMLLNFIIFKKQKITLKYYSAGDRPLSSHIVHGLCLALKIEESIP